MTRTVTNDFLTEAEAVLCRPLLLYEGTFDPTVVRLANTARDVSWDSKTWLANGYLHVPEGGGESAELEPIGFEVVLSGVPSDLLSIVLGEARQGLPGNVWFGFFDSDWQVVDDPYLLWSGKFDTANINETPTGSVITLSYESDLADLDRPIELRWTHETQRHFYPDDLGFVYVPQLQDWDGFWGKSRAKVRKKKRKRREGK